MATEGVVQKRWLQKEWCRKGGLQKEWCRKGGCRRRCAEKGGCSRRVVEGWLAEEDTEGEEKRGEFSLRGLGGKRHSLAGCLRGRIAGEIFWRGVFSKRRENRTEGEQAVRGWPKDSRGSFHERGSGELLLR